jgi:hypothetical protein
MPAGHKNRKEFFMTKHRSLFLGALVIALVCGFFLGSCELLPGDTTFSLSIEVADGSAGMGSVNYTIGSPTGNDAGASVTVTATPAPNHHFVKWSNNIAGMGSVSTTATYTFTINANTGLYAVFAPDDDTTGIFNPAGTWTTNIEEGTAQVTFTPSSSTTGSGTFTYNGAHYFDYGTFTFSGNYGTIYSDHFDGAAIGAYAMTSNTTGTLYLVPPSHVNGTYSITRQQYDTMFSLSIDLADGSFGMGYVT